MARIRLEGRFGPFEKGERTGQFPFIRKGWKKRDCRKAVRRDNRGKT